jgi:glutathione S-transferase
MTATARLWWFPISHPAQAVRRMLELKGIEYELVDVLPGNQRVHLRLAGFRSGTVPVMKLDSRRVEGSRAIARVLEELVPEPPLFPADPAAREAVEEAERWGDEEFQMVPRRILRWGLVHKVGLRRWLAEQSLPSPSVAARVTGPVSRYYAWLAHANENAVRRDLTALPEHLARVDRLLADGVISAEQPNAASYQVLSTVRSLDGFEDLHELVAAHPAAAAARALYPEDFTPTPVPRYLPRDWLPA